MMAAIDDKPGWHGCVIGRAPCEQELKQRKRPKVFSGPHEWSAWNCYRGVTCAGHDGIVALGLALSAQPLDETIGFSTEFAILELAEAREFARRLGAAIADAERERGG